jgi:Tol biopolymer transport system component
LLSDQSTNQAYSWRSSDSSVASIDITGKVKIGKVGTAVITAISSVDQSKRDTLTLTVSNPLVTFSGQILYGSDVDFELYLMKGSNAHPLQITHSGETVEKGRPRLSWDGKRVVFSSQFNAVQTVLTDGSGQTVDQELTPNSVNPFAYFMADGNILFQAYGEPHYGNSTKRLWNSPAPGVASIYSNYPINALGLIGGIAEGKMFYEASGQLVSVLVAEPQTITYLGPGGDPKLALNPNPSVFVYHYRDEIVLSTLSGSKTKLTQTPYAEFHPALSPDESQIVFVSMRDGNRDIFIMNRDGSGVVNLTNTPDINESQPDWSP